jgi:hypothetical protein
MHMLLAVRMNLDLHVMDVHLLAEELSNPILNVAIFHEKHLASYSIDIMQFQRVKGFSFNLSNFSFLPHMLRGTVLYQTAYL